MLVRRTNHPGIDDSLTSVDFLPSFVFSADVSMSLPTGLIPNAPQLPFFCSSNSLIFYLGEHTLSARMSNSLTPFADDPASLSQVLTLYNPYDFAVRYKGRRSPLRLTSSHRALQCYAPLPRSTPSSSRKVKFVPNIPSICENNTYRHAHPRFLLHLESYVSWTRHRRRPIRTLNIRYVCNSSTVESLKI